MKRIFHFLLAAAVVLAGGAIGRPASAQAPAKPVAVVSFASVNENLNDVAYVTRAAGMPDYGDTARFFVGALANGIDKQRPSGLYVLPRGTEFDVVGFLPLEPNGLNMILRVHRDQLGEAKDVGNGIREIGNNRTAYVKEQNGWAFLAENKESLGSVAQDPAALLGELPQKYNVAARLMVQNVPAEMRQTVIDELKLGIERFLSSPAALRGNIDREQAQNLTAAYLNGLERLLKEADEAFAGLGIDEQGKHIVLDLGCSAKPGTSLARTMALQTEARTNYAGFLIPEASLTLLGASRLSPEDIEQGRQTLRAARGQYLRQIDDLPDIPADKRDAVKGIVTQFFEIADESLKTGKSDGGAAIVLLPNSVGAAFGGAVADGAAVERLLKSIADAGRDIPNFPKLELNVGTLGDLRLSRLSAPLPNNNPELRDFLGGRIEVLVGVGPKSLIVTAGKDTEALMRKVLDRSRQEGDKPVSPMQLVISLLPIAKFARSINDNPISGGLVSALEQSGNDKITVETRATPTSTVTRVEVQEGVIKAIGEGVKRVGAQFNAGR